MTPTKSCFTARNGADNAHEFQVDLHEIQPFSAASACNRADSFDDGIVITQRNYKNERPTARDCLHNHQRQTSDDAIESDKRSNIEGRPKIEARRASDRNKHYGHSTTGGDGANHPDHKKTNSRGSSRASYSATRQNNPVNNHVKNLKQTDEGAADNYQKGRGIATKKNHSKIQWKRHSSGKDDPENVKILKENKERRRHSEKTDLHHHRRRSSTSRRSCPNIFHQDNKNDDHEQQDFKEDHMETPRNDKEIKQKKNFLPNIPQLLSPKSNNLDSKNDTFSYHERRRSPPATRTAQQNINRVGQQMEHSDSKHQERKGKSEGRDIDLRKIKISNAIKVISSATKDNLDGTKGEDGQKEDISRKISKALQLIATTKDVGGRTNNSSKNMLDDTLHKAFRERKQLKDNQCSSSSCQSDQLQSIFSIMPMVRKAN